MSLFASQTSSECFAPHEMKAKEVKSKEATPTPEEVKTKGGEGERRRRQEAGNTKEVKSKGDEANGGENEGDE